jgi:3-hydroxyacyl-CoA dehydrogenase
MTESDFRRAAIIGTGTMGPGMAATLARGGLDVRCFDTSADARARVPGEAELASSVLERIGGAAAAQPGAVTVHDDLAEAVDGADLVIEAVPENAEIKAAVFADLDRLAPAGAILASNTSGIPITGWSACTGPTRRTSFPSSRSSPASTPRRRSWNGSGP